MIVINLNMAAENYNDLDHTLFKIRTRCFTNIFSEFMRWLQLTVLFADKKSRLIITANNGGIMNG